MDFTTKLIAIAVMAAIFGVGPARAAVSLQPGEWQETTIGTEDGKPVAPEVEKSCMTPEEARDPASVLKTMKDSAPPGQCQKMDVQQSGDVITLVMKCGNPKEMSFDITGTFTFVSATRYTGAMKSAVTFGGKTMTQDKKIDAVRVGECKPGQGGKK
jgi:hypothetical protein